MLQINFYRETNFPNTSKPVVPHRNPDRRRRNNGFYWPRLVLFLHGAHIHTHTHTRSFHLQSIFIIAYIRARACVRVLFFIKKKKNRAATILHRGYTYTIVQVRVQMGIIKKKKKKVEKKNKRRDRL